MYQNISYEIKRDFNVSVINDDIEDILLSKPTVLLDEKIKKAVLLMTQKWVDEKIIDKLVQLELILIPLLPSSLVVVLFYLNHLLKRIS